MSVIVSGGAADTSDKVNKTGDVMTGPLSTYAMQYTTIPAGETITIPTGTQMIVAGSLTVDGTLVQDGTLVIVPDDALSATNNLSDVADVATARDNLQLGTAAVANTGDFDAAGSAAAAIASLGGADGTVSDEQLRNWAGQLPELMTSVTRTDYSESWAGVDGQTKYAGFIAVTGTVTWPDGVTGHLDGAEYPESPGVLQYFTASHVASGKIVVQSPLVNGVAGITVVTPDYYVDSAAAVGGDGSLAAPFDTIADLGTVAESTIVALKSGSEWREQLSVTNDSIAIYRYGAGNRPHLRGDDVQTNASFAKSGGYTNLYQIDITTNYIASEPGFVGVWEDDTRLPIVTSLANCDATAGSYYVANHNAVSITLYIHASDGSDITGNGKVYEATTRNGGIFAAYGDNVSGLTVDGVRCGRNYSNGGAIKIGKSSLARHCLTEDGNKHNFYMRTGSAAYGCVADGAYFNTSFTMFVYNEDTPSSEGISFYDCVAKLDTLDTPGIGFYGHYNTSGNMGAVALKRCYAENLVLGFDLGSIGTSSTLLYEQCLTPGCRRGYQFAVSTATTVSNPTISECHHQDSGDNTNDIININTTTYTVDVRDSYLEWSNSRLFIGMINANAVNGTTLNLARNVFYCTDPSASGREIVYAPAKTVIVNAVDNYVKMDGNSGRWLDTAAGSTITTNRNRFSRDAISTVNNGITYATVTLAQAAGYDTVSIVG